MIALRELLQIVINKIEVDQTIGRTARQLGETYSALPRDVLDRLTVAFLLFDYVSHRKTVFDTICASKINIEDLSLSMHIVCTINQIWTLCVCLSFCLVSEVCSLFPDLKCSQTRVPDRIVSQESYSRWKSSNSFQK